MPWWRLLWLIPLVPAPAALHAGDEPKVGPTPGGRLNSVARPVLSADMRKRLGLVPEYENLRGVEPVKVAVLDYGFDGVGGGRPTCPPGPWSSSTTTRTSSAASAWATPSYRKAFEPLNRHGRIMAQIVWAVTGPHPEGPKFYLLNANGPTMLRRAVRYAIEQEVDIILFSGSFEGGGNGDGRGPDQPDRRRGARRPASSGSTPPATTGGASTTGRCASSPTATSGSATGRTSPPCGSATASTRTPSPSRSPGTTTARRRTPAPTRTSTSTSRTGPAGGSGPGEKVQVSGGTGPGAGREPQPPRARRPGRPARQPRVPADPDYSYRIRVRAKRAVHRGRPPPRPGDREPRRVLPPGGDAPAEAVEFLDATGEGEIYPRPTTRWC